MTARTFTGRTVVVTGAAGGLGHSLCLRFAAAGARIAALDRDPVGLQSLAAELQAQGADFLSQTCDITEEQACLDAMQAIEKRFGAIDVLINNAGISHRSLLAHTAHEVIRRVMAVNFFGALHCTHAALPALRQSHGLIVAISSVAGFSPLIGRTGYAASKHALHGFFDSLRTELEDDGVGVLLVCPSFIDSGIDKAALGADGQAAAHARKTAGRQSTPQAVADAVFSAAARGRPLLLFSPVAKAAWCLSRLWPGRYAALMKRRLQDEFIPNENPLPRSGQDR
jgi:NAD(P)-dependent dehydrogenase (short-subunit alcohol dehydrogenase family)